MTTKIRKAFTILLVGFVFLFSGCTQQTFFTYKDSLSCKISKTTSGGDRGKIILVRGLLTNQPKATWPSGITSPMKKISDDSESVTIQLVASTGSIDSIVIDKTDGSFVRTASGQVGGVYLETWSGKCK